MSEYKRKKKPKYKTFSIRLNENDFDVLLDVAKSMDMNISQLFRFSINPYLIRKELIEALQEDINNDVDVSKFEKLDIQKKMLSFYCSRMEELRNELQMKLDVIENAERLLSKTINDKQLRLRFRKKNIENRIKV